MTEEERESLTTFIGQKAVEHEVPIEVAADAWRQAKANVGSGYVDWYTWDRGGAEAMVEFYKRGLEAAKKS